jgi:FAD/FMN-containing dehydrogenase
MDSTLRHLTDRIQAATADRTPLRIRGGGSKDFYGESLQGELLDMTALTGITSYEPSELVVTARAGTPLVELEATLAAQGQCRHLSRRTFMPRCATLPASHRKPSLAPPWAAWWQPV